MAVPATPTAVTTSAVQEALMNQGSGSPFASLKCVLFTAGGAPVPSSTLAQFTLATFGGYTPAAVTQGVSYLGSDGLVHVSFAGVQFSATGAGLPVTVQGYGLTNTAGTIWVGGALLAAPIPLTVAGQAIVVEPDLVYGA
jgi:hypothetical protein